MTDLAQSWAHSTISTYLAGVRHLHIINGVGNPLEGKLQLQLVLKGVHRIKPQKSCPRLPITPLILATIKAALDGQATFDDIMLWAACCVGFFGFMRCGEFTVAAAATYDSSKHLSVRDVAVDNHTDPTMIAVTLRYSKTDQFGAGTTVHLGRTATSICPVSALFNYLAVRPPGEGHLFITQEGTPLTKALFMQRVKAALSQAGMDTSWYKGHSFRIGAATTAAAVGMNEGLIKTLGQWNSSAYQTYIQMPPTEVASMSAMLGRISRNNLLYIPSGILS